MKQPPIDSGELPKTLKETFAEKMMLAHRELVHAQRAVQTDDSDENRARYAKALYDYDQLQGMFPFVAAGAGDVQA